MGEPVSRLPCLHRTRQPVLLHHAAPLVGAAHRSMSCCPCSRMSWSRCSLAASQGSAPPWAPSAAPPSTTCRGWGPPPPARPHWIMWRRRAPPSSALRSASSPSHRHAGGTLPSPLWPEAAALHCSSPGPMVTIRTLDPSPPGNLLPPCPSWKVVWQLSSSSLCRWWLAARHHPVSRGSDR
jgi:hypothetical protein